MEELVPGILRTAPARLYLARCEQKVEFLGLILLRPPTAAEEEVVIKGSWSCWFPMMQVLYQR